MHQDVLIRPKFDPSSNVSSAPVFLLLPISRYWFQDSIFGYLDRHFTQTSGVVMHICLDKIARKEKQTFAEDFVKLLTEDYGANINRTALETQTKNKRQSKVVLPLKEISKTTKLFER
ncbi:hypothetical protein JTB14_015700 [Gonioctena quinquepunctata]|nr:hypothetical protein JTB14_015700 [Gonioctena quinquepunctata]